jgi:hypothetical protein
MGPLLFPVRRTKKPNAGARLNAADPRARGLRYALAFNEGGGGYLASAGDLRNHAPQGPAPSTVPTAPVIGSAANVTWSAKRCLTYASSTSSYVDLGQNDDTTGEVTWVAHVRPTSIPALSTIFGQNRVDGSESIDSVYLSSGKLSWWSNSGSTGTEVINGTATLSADTSYRLAGRRSGSAGAWTYTTWINEEQDDTAAYASNPSLYTSPDGNFCVGFAGAYTGAPFIGDYDCFFFWHGVALKDPDLLALSANPWQLFEPAKRSWSFPAPAAPGGGNRRRRVLMCAGGR